VPVSERWLRAVAKELVKAEAKHPEWPTDPLHAIAIIGEEFGELTQAVLQVTYEPGKSLITDVQREAAQTAAMALRFLQSMDAYVYADDTNTHRQDNALPAPGAEAAPADRGSESSLAEFNDGGMPLG
jgi:NTP pyrophosphatase (non-canonical NTP hydrolase)